MKLPRCGSLAAACFFIFVSLSVGPTTASQLNHGRSLRAGRSPVAGDPPLRAAATTAGNHEAGQCSLMGGLVSPNVSARCCFSVQVATQRGLSAYGMAEPCKTAWKCQADGVTPEEGFEDQARKEVCSEPSCPASVAKAMRDNWKTAKAAHFIETLCDDAIVSVANGTKDGLIRASAEGLVARPDRASRRRRPRTNNTDNRTQSACFPGEALVEVRGRGAVPIASLRPGEWVLSAKPEVGAVLTYEPVLDWIHVMRGAEASFRTIYHEQGILRASPGHLVFATTPSGNGNPTDVAAGLLQKGDVIFAKPAMNSKGSKLVKSKIFRVEDGFVSSSMYAPLTHTGMVLVDGVLASNYATPSLEVRLPHWLAHAGLRPVRMLHSLGLHGFLAAVRAAFWRDGGLEGVEPEIVDNMHPYFSLLYHGLHMHKWLQSA